MAIEGAQLNQIETQGIILIRDTVLSSVQDPGQIVPVGKAVLVTAVSCSSSVANVLHIQSGGATSPTHDIFDIDLNLLPQANMTFRHPLLCDGLALQWSAAGTLRVAVAYKVLNP